MPAHIFLLTSWQLRLLVVVVVVVVVVCYCQCSSQSSFDEYVLDTMGQHFLP